MGKPNLRIHPIIATFMIVVALIYDVFKIVIEILSLGFLGWIINPFINFWAQMTFLFWFTYLGISFIKPSKMRGARIASMGIPSIVGLLPLVGDLPLWTSSVLTNLATIYAEDMVSTYSPQALQAMAGSLGKINGNSQMGTGTKNESVEQKLARRKEGIARAKNEPVDLGAYNENVVKNKPGDNLEGYNESVAKSKNNIVDLRARNKKTGQETEQGELTERDTDEEQIDWPIAT